MSVVFLGAHASSVLRSASCGTSLRLKRVFGKMPNTARKMRALPNSAGRIEVVEAPNDSTIQRFNVVRRRSEAKP
jgi:hypothetical protein